MTYNQVQLFRINDFAKPYMGIEIIGYRVLYNESIADRGIAILISWLVTGDCFNRVFDLIKNKVCVLAICVARNSVYLINLGTKGEAFSGKYQ